jgi:hypothetical protein
MVVLCMSGCEPSVLYIRILSHRTGAMRNFAFWGFYDVGRIDAATKKRPQSRENPRRRPRRRRRGAEKPSPAVGGEEGTRRSWWRRVFGALMVHE